MSVQVVVINGVGGAGKDEFVKTCHDMNYHNIPDVYNISMIDYVKEAATQLGWDGRKNDEGRKFLSDLKDALEAYNDGPYTAIKSRIHDIVESDNYITGTEKNCIIFIHAREPHDIKRLVTEYNAFTLLIRRPDVEENHEFTNHADLDILQYHPYDYIYWNIRNIDDMGKDAYNFLEIVYKFGKRIGEE